MAVLLERESNQLVALLAMAVDLDFHPLLVPLVDSFPLLFPSLVVVN